MIELEFLDLDFSVCRLDPAQEPPSWTRSSRLLNICRTAEELSIVCETSVIPVDAQVEAESGWSAFRVAGTLDFSLTGVLASIAAPLAEAGISIFAISTFDTDYVLIPTKDREEAKRALSDHFNVSDG